MIVPLREKNVINKIFVYDFIHLLNFMIIINRWKDEILKKYYTVCSNGILFFEQQSDHRILYYFII